jgi:hypothetical protein
MISSKAESTYVSISSTYALGKRGGKSRQSRPAVPSRHVGAIRREFFRQRNVTPKKTSGLSLRVQPGLQLQYKRFG